MIRTRVQPKRLIYLRTETIWSVLIIILCGKDNFSCKIVHLLEDKERSLVDNLVDKEIQDALLLLFISCRVDVDQPSSQEVRDTRMETCECLAGSLGCVLLYRLWVCASGP